MPTGGFVNSAVQCYSQSHQPGCTDFCLSNTDLSAENEVDFTKLILVYWKTGAIFCEVENCLVCTGSYKEFG